VRRGSFSSVANLQTAIAAFLKAWNEAPRPRLDRTVESIQAKLSGCRQTLEQIKPGCNRATNSTHDKTNAKLIIGHHTSSTGGLHEMSHTSGKSRFAQFSTALPAFARRKFVHRKINEPTSLSGFRRSAPPDLRPVRRVLLPDLAPRGCAGGCSVRDRHLLKLAPPLSTVRRRQPATCDASAVRYWLHREASYGRWPRYNEILGFLRSGAIDVDWRALDDSWLEFPADLCPAYCLRSEHRHR